MPTITSLLALLPLLPNLVSTFSLFTQNDLDAFDIPQAACRAALLGDIACTRKYIFGDYADFDAGTSAAVTARNAFCNVDGTCRQSFLGWRDAVMGACDLDVPLGPTANIGSIVGHATKGAYLPCLTSAAGQNCRQFLIDTITLLDPSKEIGEVVPKDTLCGECWLGTSLLIKQLDRTADQSLFYLTNTLCDLDSISEVYASMVHPVMPVIPAIVASNSSMTFPPPEEPTRTCGPTTGTRCPSGQCCGVTGQCGTGSDFCSPTNCFYGYGNCDHAVTDSQAVCGATSASFANCTTGCCNAQGQCGTGASYCQLADPDAVPVAGRPAGCQQAFSKAACTRALY
ncbi:hypothetical protein HDV00_010359 [Rhizophlyctis rosea]|nr:hypothetical protein HDV00_010359 [Rhizophlyctis rosea]